MAKQKPSSPQMRPASPETAPDPARSYGREKPEAEAGMGRLDNNMEATPAATPDKMEQAVGNKQPLRQINADDTHAERAKQPPSKQPDSSAKTKKKA